MAALVAAFLYHERDQTANRLDLLSRLNGSASRKAERTIEKFLHRKTVGV